MTNVAELVKGMTVDEVSGNHIAEVTAVSELDYYEVTEDDLRAYFKRHGWPTWDDLSYDHLKSERERKILHKAVAAARKFSDVIKDGAEGLAMVLLSGPVDGDAHRTGYGCGKTTLAHIVQYSLVYYYQIYRPEDLQIHSRAYFWTSKELLARFDRDDVDLRHPIGNHSLNIIDDVGREGNLRWEKRDPELQLIEKQDRYYSVIDYALTNGLNLLLTSNMSAKELAGFLGGAAWSRLLQMCPPEFRVNMTGLPDMRPLLGEQQADNWGF